MRSCDAQGLCGSFSALRHFSTGHTEPKRYYYLTDHLGSVRATVNEDGAVVQASDYYPFGLEMPGRQMVAGAKAKENFTGHELDDETGLLYMGARYYDPAIGRVHGVDPLADAYPGTSPYAYVLNNPITLIDPTGACPEDGSEGDAGDGDGYCLAEITVEAERDSDPWLGWGLMDLDSDGDGEPEGRKFYFDASTRGGYQALHDFLMQSNDFACSMVGNEQFSMNARSAAMAACIHSGQAAFLDHPYSQAFLGLVYGGGAGYIAGRAFAGLRGLQLTTSDGFLLKGFSINAPFNISVGRFGAMSIKAGKLDHWAPRLLGSSRFVGRRLLAIKPSWNSLNTYTTGVIPKGTPIRVGIVGPQGWRYPGGGIQIMVRSRQVVGQSSRLFPGR